ncbi:MAG: cold shock domain-containing protein [Deltaproteobacteria bacterium]|nr:cold shock domain-containing protein [Deltaproteobacteria bacterium]
MSDEKRHNGEVISFEYGWGFLLDYDTQESIFVHHTQIDQEGFRVLYPLDKVSFLIGVGNNGKSQALNVVVEVEP